VSEVEGCCEEFERISRNWSFLPICYGFPRPVYLCLAEIGPSLLGSGRKITLEKDKEHPGHRFRSLRHEELRGAGKPTLRPGASYNIGNGNPELMSVART